MEVSAFALVFSVCSQVHGVSKVLLCERLGRCLEDTGILIDTNFKIKDL